MKLARALAMTIVLVFGGLSFGLVPAGAHTVPGGGTRYTVTVATDEQGLSDALAFSGYRTGSRTEAQRADYIWTAAKLVGPSWTFQSTSECGRTTCKVRFLLNGTVVPVTTTINVVRYRHNHAW